MWRSSSKSARAAFAVLLCASLLAVPVSARADDADRASPRDWLAMFVEAGLGGPFGWLGLGADLRPTSWWSVQVGAGVQPGGLQAGLATEFHVPLPHDDTLGVLFGVSLDHYAQHNTFLASDSFTKRWQSSWLYLAVQGRKRLAAALFIRATIGITAPVAKWDYSCGDNGNRYSADDRSACVNAEFNGQLSAFFAVGLEVPLL